VREVNLVIIIIIIIIIIIFLRKVKLSELISYVNIFLGESVCATYVVVS
jgi:hypothetical protein